MTSIVPTSQLFEGVALRKRVARITPKGEHFEEWGATPQDRVIHPAVLPLGGLIRIETEHQFRENSRYQHLDYYNFFFHSKDPNITVQLTLTSGHHRDKPETPVTTRNLLSSMLHAVSQGYQLTDPCCLQTLKGNTANVTLLKFFAADGCEVQAAKPAQQSLKPIAAAEEAVWRINRHLGLDVPHPGNDVVDAPAG